MNRLSRFLVGGTGAVLSSGQQARLAAWRKLPTVELACSHLKTRYVVVNIDTAGLDPVKNKLTAIGAVAVTGGLIGATDAFEVALPPKRDSGHGNILIHDPDDSAQREVIDPAEALLRFLDYVGKAPLVAYRADFDRRMIAGALNKYLGATIKLTWIDLAWVLPEVFRDRAEGRVELGKWLQMFDIGAIHGHDVLRSAYATAQLMQVVISRTAIQGGDSAAALIETARARRSLRRGDE